MDTTFLFIKINSYECLSKAEHFIKFINIFSVFTYFVLIMVFVTITSWLQLWLREENKRYVTHTNMTLRFCGQHSSKCHKQDWAGFQGKLEDNFLPAYHFYLFSNWILYKHLLMYSYRSSSCVNNCHGVHKWYH